MVGVVLHCYSTSLVRVRTWVVVSSPSTVSNSRRIRMRTRNSSVNEMMDKTGGGVRSLKQGIAEFYDESSSVWEDIWGDHMHHGFYDNEDVGVVDNRAAQIRMIREALLFAGVSSPSKVLDVGCGIGGSSRYMASELGCSCKGVTLSPVQAARANALASAQGLSDDRASFQVADALDLPFPDASFDLVWSMESGEHMPDKPKFVSELARVAAPGAAIVIVTWCHRDVGEGESLLPWELTLLNRICRAFYLPSWCSAADYVTLLNSLGLQDVRSADWTHHVAPFWPAVIRSALTWKGLTSLLFRAGWKTLRGALAMPLMIQGYNKGLIKFSIISANKPPLNNN